LQHAHNPVDWYPWGEEAFARAKAEDKPILLSVGYSACHWCHVMERESFENADTAAVMNRHFVSIKVDREERPDVDHIYMQAVQAARRRDPLLGVPGRVGAVRRGAWGARRGAEVSAADDLGVRPALRSPQRQPVRAAHGAHDAREDGARRDVRPARRRFRALLRGPALAGAALREDALRQRAARLALPARLAGLRGPGVPAHCRGDPRLRAARD